MPNSTTTTIVAPGPPRSAVSTNIKFPATPGPVSLPLPKRIQDYNSTANMYLLISGKHHPESSTLTALGQARAYKDITQVTPLIEFMRFQEAEELRGAIVQALMEIAGEQFSEDPNSWFQWSE